MTFKVQREKSGWTASCMDVTPGEVAWGETATQAVAILMIVPSVQERLAALEYHE